MQSVNLCIQMGPIYMQHMSILYVPKLSPTDDLPKSIIYAKLSPLNLKSRLNTAYVLLNHTDNPWGVDNFKHKPTHVFHTVGNY